MHIILTYKDPNQADRNRLGDIGKRLGQDASSYAEVAVVYSNGGKQPSRISVTPHIGKGKEVLEYLGATYGNEFIVKNSRTLQK